MGTSYIILVYETRVPAYFGKDADITITRQMINFIISFNDCFGYSALLSYDFALIGTVMQSIHGQEFAF